jgi:iron complex transport system permease protein
VSAPGGTAPAESDAEVDLEDVVAAQRPLVRPGILVAALVAGLVVACTAAVTIGLDVGPTPAGMGDSVLWDIRFPRVALAALVGAALGCAGASMQGTFSNPLAEPGIVGVSSGAALGAVGAIVLGLTGLGAWSTTVAAFVGGVVTLALVYVAARSDGRTEVVTLILTGIAVNALAGAFIGLLMFVSTDAELRSITFWQLGSVAQATWPKVAAVAPVALLGTIAAFLLAPKLDLLALGERSARHIGVDVERLRVTMLVVVGLLTAAAVAVSGIILFVGLVVPHLVRMVVGPAHRVLVVCSALGGAVLLVVGDLAARTLREPAEIPLGVLTALVGSPFFFWLLRRTRASQGGWA